VLELGVGDLTAWREEAHVDRSIRELGNEVFQPGEIGADDRPDVRHPAVHEQDV
jgi:hypothetical protein